MPETSGYAGWGRLGSANGTAESAKKRQIGTNFRLFAGFALIWRGRAPPRRISGTTYRCASPASCGCGKGSEPG